MAATTRMTPNVTTRLSAAATATRTVNNHGSVEIPACLWEFKAKKACKHTGDTRAAINTPKGSKKMKVGVQQQRMLLTKRWVRGMHKPVHHFSFSIKKYLKYPPCGCSSIVALCLHSSPVNHRLFLIRVVGNAGGPISREGGRSRTWKGQQSITGQRHPSAAFLQL